MQLATKRALAAGATVAVAAAVNVSTGMLTQKWSLAWGACAVALVIVGVGLQVWLTHSEATPSARQHIEDVQAGSVHMEMGGSGEQVVKRVKAKRKFTQRQG
ncbi:hypothetical protein [Streptomyces solicathayae]|uniref:Uncharacterized protein n=1 Tax=Streptomyces solicathayae TaxID=3081768 RepID=A0ABZ0LTI2_9ACTN|nr:hypothetical protein [Streptomyces sp. HUAS YS2]WOX22811.1 hypothetical protein R2D22_15960 [Streptomyces sp. HUAS YS2]